jgi:Mg2+/Co2+ transporter CorC
MPDLFDTEAFAVAYALVSVLHVVVGEIEDEFDSEADEVRVGERRVPADGEEAG